MARVYNFNPGPAVLPERVLERVRDELLEWGGTGMSVMEASHRGKPFRELAERSTERLRRLLSVPDTHRVLFMHGPSRIHYSAVPMNLLGEGQSADYLDTGIWSTMAIEEARRYGAINVAASAKDTRYTTIPARDTWRLDPEAAYLHYTPNETIGGVEYHEVPDAGGVPLVADMTSNILSCRFDVARFGVVYAGAQKNAGISGLTLVLVREDVLDRARDITPDMLRYKTHADGESLASTAPTFAWYVADKVFEWLEEEGGIEAMERANRRKSAKLYDYIDGTNFYSNPVEPGCRSVMNVPFILADAELDGVFLEEAEAAGLAGLKGHRFVGGMRASLYNGMPEAGVDALIDFMGDFVRRKG